MNHDNAYGGEAVEVVAMAPDRLSNPWNTRVSCASQRNGGVSASSDREGR